jgi:hypothetical protein
LLIPPNESPCKEPPLIPLPSKGNCMGALLRESRNYYNFNSAPPSSH